MAFLCITRKSMMNSMMMQRQAAIVIPVIKLKEFII